MAKQISILNDPPVVVDGPQLLHGLVEFDKHRDAFALDFTSRGKRRQYTYQELQLCVTSLVIRIEKLLAINETPTEQSLKQHIIPILLPQSPGLYISQLAILESGGAFCPVNLDAPKERIKFVVGDVSAKIIITTSEFEDLVTWPDGPAVMIVDRFPTVPKSKEFKPRRAREPSSHELAYIMYTSGSSGTPKGVAVSHLAVSQSLLAHEKLLPSFQRFLQFAAPSFDVSVFEIFFPLTRGCTLVGCDRDQLLNDLSGMINKLDVDAAELTPTVVGSLLQKRSNVPNLRLLLTIGEMLTRPIVEEFGGSATKESILYGMYGPTEAAIHCTIHPNMKVSAKPGNIGVPFDTVSAFIAAASSTAEDAGIIKLLPAGELGELVLGGPQLAQGYLNREKQNKAAFIHSEGKDYYRTGDKARLLEDGTIEILGRISAGQVKLRGQRIELGEVEEVVYKHPGVKTVLAVVISGNLVVFALTDDEALEPDHVIKLCAKWLPKFMIPGEIVLLQHFPYLPSGKVDKRKLEAEYQSKVNENEEESNISATPTERIVEETVRVFLGPFTRKTRLAAAGLDSLVAIRVASRLRSSGFDINAVAVLQADTVAQLTKLCETTKAMTTQKIKPKLVSPTRNFIESMNGNPKDVDYIMACTPLQSAMLSETVVHCEAYMNWVELDLLDISDTDRVISSLENLSKHNSMLRTGFAESGDSGAFVQIVWKTLATSQIEKVDKFHYKFEASMGLSLHRPLRIQVRLLDSSIKLLLHLHHALYDAWSLELLLDDLDTLLTDRRPPSRPPFTNIVEGYLDGTLEVDSWTSKDYWKDYLSDLDIRQVPNFHNTRASASGLAIANLVTGISTSNVEIAAKNLSSSPQSLFQAAYTLILSSYLESSDICFGTVFSGRTLPIADIEDIVGPCLATLPVRIDLTAYPTFRDLVQDLNSSNRKHLEHSTVPLRDIKSICGAPPGQLLFDTLLIWQQTLHSYDHSRTHVSLVESIDNLEFNLTLEIVPTTENIELRANYQQSLFPKSQVDLLLKQIEQLVKAIVRDETISVDEAFCQLSEDVLSIENEHPQVALKPGTLSSPVEKIAYEDPDRPAINFATSIDATHIESQRVTYSKLNSRANRIGQHLLSRSLLPDELVCICMEKCVDLYASILASAKIGIGYLPVTPDIPAERLQHILREAKVKVILAQSDTRELLKPLRDVEIVYVDEVKFSAVSSDNIPPRSSPHNISYCIFTSGSTGTPKGVLVTQGNLLSNLDVLEDLYPATKDMRLLQSCSQSFDVSVFEIFFTWRMGGCLSTAVKDVLFRDIERAIRALDITHLSLTPTVAALIDPRNAPSVQFLVTAGEAVTQRVFNAWAGRGLYQGYGPSETTNICTVKPDVLLHDSINNIGQPLKNTSAFVLSPGLEFSPVPRGGGGELCFGGSQVFRGYMDKNQNTGKIIEHPRFGRLYRSGDFGRLMPDGSLAFTRRKDDQVKIRGQRVELGEINSIMLKSKEVCDCVTMVISGNLDASQRLVCFWAPGLKTSTEVEALRPEFSTLTDLYKALEAALPSYMVPSALIPISYLPSTSQGKIDKRFLIKLFESLDLHYLDLTAQSSRSTSGHTWTENERNIAEALALYTKTPLEDIKPETSFFSLGIDSISAISFIRILRKKILLPVDITDILKYSSIIKLEERISSRSEIIDKNAAENKHNFQFGKDFLMKTTEDFRKAGKIVDCILPCTPLQEAMLSAAQSSSENLYSNLVIFNVNGDLKKLQKCWQEMVQRHEILRTCFIETDDPQYAYAQVVLETFSPAFNLIDAPSDMSRMAKVLKSSTATSQDEPPYSFGVVQSMGRAKLLISMHHALYDGIALGLLYHEVEKLYHDETLPSSVSFAPFLRRMLSTKLEDSDRFWQAVLKDCFPTRIKPISSKSLNSPKFKNFSAIHRENATPRLSWIEDRAKKYSTSLLAICHTVWASLLSERLGETDVCFGNVVSGRTNPVDGIEQLVAPCFNTIPARLQDVHKLTYLEAFRKFQIFNADLLPFQLTPLRRIQAKFSPDGLRLFDTLFILQPSSQKLDPSIWSISEENGAMDFPLVCELAPNQSEDALEIILHSHSSFFCTEAVTAIISSFNMKLQLALENPRQQLLSSTVKERIAKTTHLEASIQSFKASQSSKSMTPEEIKIREVISSFTNVPTEKISRDVSIFRLGLDSISAVQVAARLRKQGHTVLASDILEHPTISQLSAHLAQNRGPCKVEGFYNFDAFDHAHRETICSNNGVPEQEVEAIRPCTAVQQGMLAQTLHSQGKQYVNSMWFELLPNVSILAMREAWATVCRNYEMLRSGFVQTYDPKNPFALITYTEQGFSLPWVVKQVGERELSIVDQLAHQPWCLTVIEENDRTIIKLTAHHALYDSHSIQMILLDVARAYLSEPLASRSSINLLLGQIMRDERDHVEEQKSFWQRDENRIIVNRFPDLTPLRISDSTNSVREIFSQMRTSDLEELCMQRGVTVQAAGQAAWARLLAAYTGESSTTFGVTLSGRSVHEGAESVPFPTIVTLPVRCDVMGSNEDLLSRTMRKNASTHKYQFTPLTSIQRWAEFPEGNIFDTLFAYQKSPDALEFVHIPWKIVREEATVDYAVSLEVQPTDSGDLALRITFRVDLIPVEHSELLLRQYDALLLDILQNPKGSCGIVPNIGTALLSITPAQDHVLPGSVSLLHEFLERGANDHPSKKALEFATCLEIQKFQSRSWTYEQVNEEANKVAQFICHRGIVPGELVAICFDKCAEASFTIVGILKAGCGYVALDPNAPPERIKFIIKDSGAKFIMTAGKPSHNFQSIGIEVVNLDCPNVLEGYSLYPPKLARDISPQDTCYCLYTSGTTGTPKGCLITHDNAVQAMYSFQRLFSPHWTDNSKWLQFASFHFDVSVLEQFWSWSVGLCVASAPRDLIFEDIPGAIRQLGITHIDLTPSLARLLHPSDVPALCNGVFITGGEQLRQDILDIWGEHTCIYNGYGPTEATIGCTMFPRVPKNGKPSNIGRQFDNVGSYVLKPSTTVPVLRGGVGELCVSGKLVGKGYLNRPDLTIERFPVIQPFNERVYRTGDLVRILHDGSFIFLGRADDQVKLRGQRLELSEINQVIKKSSKDLQEVVTLVLKHKAQKKEQLITFFVPSSLGCDTESDHILTMREACKTRLPGYMVPTHFIPIQALPLNANNKADVKQLVVIYDNLSVDYLQKLSHSSQQKRNWSSSEKAILDTLARVLDVEISSLTREITIFELGLDSISIIGFSRALQTAGLSKAKMSFIKSNPAIGNLVQGLMSGHDPSLGMENAYLAASQQIAAFSQKHMISVCQELGTKSSGIESIAPCTPVQEGMIYRFLESEHSPYFYSFDFLLKDKVDTKNLEAAWNRVVARLEILRTIFVLTDDGYAQVVMKRVEVSGSHTTDYNKMAKTDALRNPQSFAITQSARGTIACLRIFHGLYDGNSLTMMLRRVVDEYHSRDDIEYGPSFQSSLQYGPLVKLPGAGEFWANHLRDWTYQPVPTTQNFRRGIAATYYLKNLDGLEELRKKLGVTHQAMIQATWLSVLQEKVPPISTIGVVSSGRTIDFEGAEKVIGPLFNTLPFHVKIDRNATKSSFIARCHDINIQMQNFQHTPLKDIQKWSPARPGQPLFDTLFAFLRPDLGDNNFAEDLWTKSEQEQTADYPLAFEASLDPKCQILRLTIVTQDFSVMQWEAVELLEKFEKSLNATLREAGKAIASSAGVMRIMINGRWSTVEDQSEVPDIASPKEAQNEAFRWTKEATLIRREIALLADIEEHQVYPTSSIFELGLDSIDVIKLSSRLSKQSIAIPVSAIIKSQTIEKMTTNISDNGSQSQPAPIGKTVQEISQDLITYLKDNQKLPEDAEAVLPATPLQQSMVNEMVKSKYKRYFTVEAFEVDDNCDAPKLLLAVDRVMQASPILRTTFTEIHDPRSPVSYAQIVRHCRAFSVEISEQETLEDYLDQFKNQSAALAVSDQTLCDAKCVAVGSKRYLVMAISHALYDGRSIRAVHEDIQSAYYGKLSPRPDPLPYLNLVFQSTTEDAKRFWRSSLSNLPSSGFPRKDFTELSDPAAVHRMDAHSCISLKDAENFCRSSRITLQTLGQTCWAVVLSHLMGQLDVVFGSVLSCRDSEEAEKVMFPLMNTVAVRSVLHGSVSEMLKYMQEMSDRTRQYQHFPLGTAKAIALASREDESSTNDITLFDTLFIYQGRRQTSESKPLYKSVYGSSDVEFPVCVEMEIVDGEFLTWTIACKAIVRTTMETKEIMTTLDEVLRRIIAAPQDPVILSDSEGISVCGLPKFRKLGSPPMRVPSSFPKKIDENWSDLELKIRQALHRLSNIPEDAIYKDSTIFYLGLDSILVLKLPALLQKHGIKLSVSTILKNQTIHAMAQSVLQADRADPVKQESLNVDQTLLNAMSSLDMSIIIKSLEKKVGEVQYVMPTTAGQEYMVRTWRVSRGSLFYPTFEYTLAEPVVKSKLDVAWKALLQENDILRTGFVDTGAGLVQVVFKHPQNKVIYQAPTGRTAPHTLSDLSFPPVALSIESKDSKTTLKLRIHHALYDGISLPLLVNQLESLYRGQRMPPSDLSFRKFVAQSITTSQAPQNWSQFATRMSTRNKWKSYIDPWSQTPLLAISGTSAINHNKRTEVFHPALKISPLKRTAQNSGVTIDALLLAAISKIYAQKLDLHDTESQIVFGVYLANRAPFGEDLSQLAAPTLNLLPLHVRDPLSRKVPDIAKDIQNDLREISSSEMSCASLANIYEWCEARINFFVNILKDNVPETVASRNTNATEKEKSFSLKQKQDLSKKAIARQLEYDDRIPIVIRHVVYLPAVDIEIRYHGSSFDMGVFGPTSLVSVAEAEDMIKDFTQLLA